jgi:hypothetical protein
MLHWFLDTRMAAKDSVFNLLFGCNHRRTTFPMTPVRKKSAGWRDETLAETYVVCLECGKQFVYDWENMRLGRAVEIADGAPHDTEATKVPFRTKSKLRYLFWGSALSAALVLGKVVQSRKRSPSASAEDHGQGDDNKNPKDPRTP